MIYEHTNTRKHLDIRVCRRADADVACGDRWDVTVNGSPAQYLTRSCRSVYKHEDYDVVIKVDTSGQNDEEVAIYDLATDDLKACLPHVFGTGPIEGMDYGSWLAAELVDGYTMHQLPDWAPRAMRKHLDRAAQIAQDRWGFSDLYSNGSNYGATRDGRVVFFDVGVSGQAQKRLSEERDRQAALANHP